LWRRHCHSQSLEPQQVASRQISQSLEPQQVASRMASGSTLLLKVDLGGDLRRFYAKEGTDLDETWENLVQAVRKGFDIKEEGEFTFKYKDDEGDACTLVSETLQDCIALATGGPMRLQASFVAMKGSEKLASHGSPSVPQLEAASLGQQPQDVQSEPPTYSSRSTASGEQAAAPPPGLEECSEEGDAGGCLGSRGVGPWKLLACLGSLRAADRMSAPMIASLTFQFLPIMAQRAHRKQEKLNRVGTQQRELILPLLRRIAGQLNAVPGTEVVKGDLEAFISGKQTGKLGDCISALLKVLVAAEPKTAVAHLLKDASEELLDLLPKVFPLAFASHYPTLATHAGTTCAACNVEPIRGPRFHNTAGQLDLCGECYIDSAFDASTKWECRLAAATPCDADPVQAWKEGMKARFEGMKARKDCGKHWKELAGAFAFANMAWKGFGGKGKGKGKAKGHGKDYWNPYFASGEQQHPGSEGTDPAPPWWGGGGGFPCRDWTSAAAEWQQHAAEWQQHAAEWPMPPGWSAADYSQPPFWGAWPGAMGLGCGTYGEDGSAGDCGGGKGGCPMPQAAAAPEAEVDPSMEPSAPPKEQAPHEA